MKDTQSKLSRAIEKLPDDASWDDVWQTLLEASAPALRDSAPAQLAQNAGKESIACDAQAEDTAPLPVTSTGLKPSNKDGTPKFAEPDKNEEARNLGAKGARRKAVALIVLVAGFVALGLLDNLVDKVGQVHKILINVSVAALFYLAYRIHRTGRYYTQRAGELLKNDTRRPVVYLRSFTADSLTTKVTRFGITEEEQLVGILKTVGPVVALDNPVTEIMAPGASRASASDEEWQSRILDLMRRAKLVVIRLGDTPSLQWELMQARELLQPHQLVLIVPKKELFEYDVFRLYAERDFGLVLPAMSFSEPLGRYLFRILTRGHRFEEFYSFHGFVYFDENWDGRSAEPRLSFRGYVHSPITQRGRANICYALEPVFERLGVPLPALQINWILLAIGAFFIGGMIYLLLDYWLGKS